MRSSLVSRLTKLLRNPTRFLRDSRLFPRLGLLGRSSLQGERHYARLVDQVSLWPHTILYQCGSGESPTGVVRALFLALQKDLRFAEFEHIWALSDHRHPPAELRESPRTRVVRVHSKEYALALSAAAHLVGDGGFPSYFLCRPGQLSLYVGPLGAENAELERNRRQATAIVPSSPETATHELIERFFFEAPSPPSAHPGRTRLLFYCGGFTNNGVTTAALALLNAIDKTRYDVSVVITPTEEASRQQNLASLSPEVRRLRILGTPLFAPKERAAWARTTSTGHLTPTDEAVLRRHFSRERCRLFGHLEFDVVIDFSGYVRFWTLLFALGGFPRRVIYQHNDMAAESDKVILGERKHRQNLRIIFDAYRFFDRVVSVSEDTMLRNRESLGRLAQVSVEHFDHVDNVIDTTRIRELAREPPLVDLDPSCVNLLTLGRFSPEKGHKKLLSAFALLLARVPNPHLRLYLAGEGVLLKESRQHARSLGIDKQVYFLGQVANPYPLLARSSCLVLASDHEGQPMVVLEALSLNRPILATDIVATRRLVPAHGGRVVENTVEGLAKGLFEVTSQSPPPTQFDAENYRKAALERFYTVVCGQTD